MKNSVTLLLTICILAFPVFAADAGIYEMGDFIKNPEQVAVLAERDLARINWEGVQHQLHVRRIYLDKNKVDLTAFIEGSEVPYYVTINLKTSLQLDFNRDRVEDLKVSIINIVEKDGQKLVALKLEKLGVPSINPEVITPPEEVKETKPSFISDYKLYFLLGIILLCLAVVWKIKPFIKTHKGLKTRK